MNGDSPVGLRGPVASFAALVPEGAPALRLPCAGGVDAHFTATAPKQQAIVVAAFTESMGRVEAALQRFGAQLVDGGTLLLDVENRQSLRQLRLVIEGCSGPFDGTDNVEDPSQPLSLKRLLLAAAGAGLHVADVVRVPTDAAELGPDFAKAVTAQGLLPLDWLDGPPAARFWLVCRRQRQLAGTVLVGAGATGAQARTIARLRSFLPSDWEVVTCTGDNEAAAYGPALADATGELVWFLRAGALPSAALFEELALRAIVGPAAPANDGVRCCPGDVSGLMLLRNDALLAGLPRGEHLNTQVALEAFGMRLEICSPAPELVDGEFTSPTAAIESPQTFAAEAAALLERWDPMLKSEREPAIDAAPGAAIEAPWAGREPRVTLCMIARNEERFLGECLRRARPAVDEIIVVDTGSTDRTIEIAESFGAKIIREPWADDFAAPRNTALQAATGDWILALDADEMLTDGAAERLRELVRNPGVSGYHLHFTNIYTGGKTVGVMMVRLFRNLPGIRWQNVIHEQITPTLVAAGNARGLILVLTDIEVEHLGYTNEVMDSKKKNERNERLFAKQLAQNPDDIYSLYKYGDFLRRVPGRDRDALQKLLRCFELILAGPPSLPRGLPYAGEVAALSALELARIGEHARARDVVDQALRRFLPTPNLHYIAAGLALAEGQNDAAIAHYRRCLAYRGQVLVVPIQDGITGHVSLAGIAQAWLQKGDLERARRLVQRAIAMQPDFEPSTLLLSRLQLQAGDPQAALQTLTDFLAAHPDAAGACQQTTLILQRLGHNTHARRMGERAVVLLRANAAEHEAARMERILATL